MAEQKIIDTFTLWRYKVPSEYAKKLMKAWDVPTGLSWYSAKWETKTRDPYVEVKVVDEYVAHTFPKKHYDFVYTTISVKKAIKRRVTAEHACALMKVSGSIIIDLLKQEVTARCGGLGKNDVTLAFVLDVIEGKTKPTKQEYKRRILKDIITRKNLNLHKSI